MAKAAPHKWEFKPRFRKSAFGWKSQPAILRVKQAVTEIQKAAKLDPILGAEGAVIFLERVSPALENVDSSSGAIGSAVYHAIETLVPIIANAPASPATRNGWLERLWQACQDDATPYIENLDDHWGELCASPEVASEWADRLALIVKDVWSPPTTIAKCCRRGPIHYLSALLAAKRYEELQQAVTSSPFSSWRYRQFAVRALVAQGRVDEAVTYAEASKGLNEPLHAIAETCEQLLLSEGRWEEAYRRFAFRANEKTTHLSTFRALVKKYPQLERARILEDLIASTPGEEGKWFTAAKDTGLLDLALHLATQHRCDPMTLARAARDYAEKAPDFAVGVGFAALQRLAEGWGFDITAADVRMAYTVTLGAAEKAGRWEEVSGRIRELVAAIPERRNLVRVVLGEDTGETKQLRH